MSRSRRQKEIKPISLKVKFLELVYNPPPLFDLKIVYSYVIDIADFESDLGLDGKALVSEKMVFLRMTFLKVKSDVFSIKPTFCALIFEKMHLLIHPQSKYPTYTLKSKYPGLYTPSKVNILHTPSKVNTYIHPHNPHEPNKPKYV